MTHAIVHLIRKPAKRATKIEMGARHDALFEIVERMRQMTARQVFYQAEVAGIIEKTEAWYDKVQRALTDMRREGSLPYPWIADGTRLHQHPKAFSGIEAALENTARTYQKALWDDNAVYCEVWCEKDALSGVVYPVTILYDVSLMIARGYSSLSFLAAAAEEIVDIGKPAFVYHLGDYDPSGPPDWLRSIVKNAIERHLEILKAAEESERQAIAAFVCLVKPSDFLAWFSPPLRCPKCEPIIKHARSRKDVE